MKILFTILGASALLFSCTGGKNSFRGKTGLEVCAEMEKFYEFSITIPASLQGNKAKMCLRTNVSSIERAPNTPPDTLSKTACSPGYLACLQGSQQGIEGAYFFYHKQDVAEAKTNCSNSKDCKFFE